jgi:hypothetical protein
MPQPNALYLVVWITLSSSLLGAMLLMPAATLQIHSRKARARNSGPLSDRTYAGPGGLFAFVAGSYYQPRREERILLFIDLRASQRSPRASARSAFWTSSTDSSPTCRWPSPRPGEIHNYVGDEIIATGTLA